MGRAHRPGGTPLSKLGRNAHSFLGVPERKAGKAYVTFVGGRGTKQKVEELIERAAKGDNAARKELKNLVESKIKIHYY